MRSVLSRHVCTMNAFAERLCIPALIVLLHVFPARCIGSGQQSDGESIDTFCGPRCVQRVLEYYGIRSDLLMLVRDMQWPVSSEGTTLAQLQKELERQGISAAAVDIDADTEFDWPAPAIFHIVTRGSPHYVVWLPAASPNPYPVIWGGSIERLVTPDEFLQTRTGVVLLTSRSKIPEHPTIGRHRGERALLPYILVPTAIGMVVGFVIIPVLGNALSASKEKTQ